MPRSLPDRPGNALTPKSTPWTCRVSRATDTDPFRFLARHEGEPRALYWSAGQGHAGAGVAAEIRPGHAQRFLEARIGSASLHQHLRIERDPGVPADVGPVWFAAFDFEADGFDSEFPSGWAFLPHRQLTVRHGQSWSMTTTPVKEPNHPSRARAPVGQGVWTSRPPFDEWATSIRNALQSVRQGLVEKVVLSRELAGPARDPPALLDVVQRLNDAAPGSRTFLFEPRPGYAWIGATPEILVARKGDTIQTVALAGSRPRGRTTNEDADLERSLKSNSKEAWEHEVVVRSLRTAFNQRPYPWQVTSDRAVLKLPNVQHLETRIEGGTGPEEHVLDLVELLHPTPATSGHPRDKAMRLLATLEAKSRGWYAAPLGWYDGAGDGEFAVNLRCARWTPAGITLYAGCGVVHGSDPAEEWEESRTKLQLLQSILDGADA